MQLKSGTVLQNGKYRIIKTLGQGGFGITYEAVQVALERKVAVKEFFMKDCCERTEENPRISIPTQSNRELVMKFKSKFVREAKMIALFDHPHIVRVLDVFEENGTAYYVMENLLGGSLLDKVKREGSLPEALAERYILQVADALAYIHSQNTVHLDVKPSNILLNAKGNAVLIDFGISKHYDEAGEQTSSTPVGISKGYAPLEQGREGDVSQFKPSTDIYALGATLYYLVTGTVPPEASIVNEIVNEDGLVRSDGISDRIWYAIEKAMQPRRKDRPQTIESFLQLLMTEKNVHEDVVIHSDGPTIFVPGQTGNSLCAGHEWVDLGLPSGLKWATCNVGASLPSDYGDYFAWGEIYSKKEYTPENYKFIKKESFARKLRGFIKFNPTVYTKYVYNKMHGVEDNISQLELSDDAASTNWWGGSWRMPTIAEVAELLQQCNWVWKQQGGKNGWMVMSKTNGNSIFLPAAGIRSFNRIQDAGVFGYYWSSSLVRYLSSPESAHALKFNASKVFQDHEARFCGNTIRPVAD